MASDIIKSINYWLVITVLSKLVPNISCYSIPEPRFEILQPMGFRVSIPDTTEEPGIGLFAFHGAIDQKLLGVQPGQFFDDILQPTNGRWVYENKRLSLEPGQRIYYWIHVQHGSKGYRMLERSYKVPDFSDSSSENPQVETDDRVIFCEPSKTIVRGRKACAGELIFEENFSILNSTIWRRDVRIPLDTDDADFVVYQDLSDNCYVNNGMLYIQPTKFDEVPGNSEAKLRNGELNLGSKCTGIVDIEQECKRQAELFRILPPIVSAHINTKHTFSFQYGKIEVRAKLPKGDWLFPLIVLDPLNSDYGITGFASGQMRVAFIRANEKLQTKDGQNIDGSYLYGGVVLKTGDDDRDTWLKKVHGTEHWGNAFHTYSMTWTDSSITLAYDRNTYATIAGGFNHLSGSRIAPFDKEFYISLGLSAGGISDFPDESVSGRHKKPWQNTNPKAELTFWNARNKWYSTWNLDDSAMIIDSVKVWAL